MQAYLCDLFIFNVLEFARQIHLIRRMGKELMKNKPAKLTVFLFVAFSLGLAGCQCISVPAQDSTPPKAGLNIIFNEDAEGQPGGVERTVTITSNAAGNPPAVQIPRGRTFQVLYSGNDEGGVRTLIAEYEDLGPDSVTNPDGSISQRLIAVPSIPDGDFSSCAKTTRVLNFEWRMDGPASLKVKAVDFRGNEASTRTIEIHPQ